jgi:uncharacterized membrane protein YoaK (UPF0700 family)
VLLLWSVYAVGAVAGTVLAVRISFAALLLPLAGLALAAVLDALAARCTPDDVEAT